MTKIYTIDEGYTLLLEIYVHLMEIYELIGMNSMKPVKKVWSRIFDEVETRLICDSLGNIREIIAGVLDDIEKEEILPYSLRREMEDNE